MKVKARLLPTMKKTKTVELKEGSSVEQLLRTLDLFPDAWIAIRGGAPIPFDEELKDGDEIKLIAVVSGG